MTEHVRRLVVCPECGGTNVRCESSANVSQRVWLVSQPPKEDGTRRVALDWEPFKSDDVEFCEGPATYSCLDCMWNAIISEQELVDTQPPRDLPVAELTTAELKRRVEAGVCNDNWGNACNDATEALEEIIRRLPPAVDQEGAAAPSTSQKEVPDDE